jgi:hypothetical protein
VKHGIDRAMPSNAALRGLCLFAGANFRQFAVRELNKL